MTLIRSLLIALFFLPVAGISQEADSLIKKLDSVSIREKELNRTVENNTDPVTYQGAKLNAPTYLALLADNIKQQVTLPLRADKTDWIHFGEFAAITGAVALVNKPINRFAVNLYNNNPRVASVSNYVTKFGGAYEVYTIAGFYAFGLIFKTEKEKNTTALATQAYIAAGLIGGVAKLLAGVQRPYHVDPITGKQGPIFHGPLYLFQKGPDGKRLGTSDYSSFPSGHTTAAFAAATVYAMEYKDKPLIPILSYTAASMIGLSRITENRHWPMDVVVGAMLGYLSGRQVVNNYHRYSRMKHMGKSVKKSVSFNLQYLNRQVVPGLAYRF